MKLQNLPQFLRGQLAQLAGDLKVGISVHVAIKAAHPLPSPKGKACIFRELMAYRDSRRAQPRGATQRARRQFFATRQGPRGDSRVRPPMPSAVTRAAAKHCASWP